MCVSQHCFSLPYGKIHVQCFGDPAGTPMLAVHGWLDNSASFATLAAHLPEYAIWAIDLPGHGWSDHRPAHVPLHFRDHVLDVAWLIEAYLPQQPWVFLGHSLGAGIAGAVVSAFPERFSALLCLDALGPMARFPKQHAPKLRSLLESYLHLADKGLRPYDSVEAACAHRAQVNRIAPELLRPLVERGMRQHGDGYVWRTDPRLMIPPFWYEAEADILAHLGEIRTPTAVLRGTHGYPFGPLLAPRLAAVAQHNRLEYAQIPYGHHLHLEAPEQVADWVRRVLPRLKAPFRA